MGERMRVAVIGLADGPVAEAGAGVLACLDPERYERIGVLGDPNEAGAARPGVIDRALLLPPLLDVGFLPALVEAIVAEDLRVLLPGSPRAAAALARGRGLLAPTGVALPRRHVSSTSITDLSGEGLTAAARWAGVAARERTEVSADEDSFEPFETWPIALIGAEGARRVATDAWEAIRAVESLERDATRVVACPWNPEEVFEVALSVSRARELLGMAAVRVLADDARTRPWLAVTIENRPLVVAAARFAYHNGLVGPLHFLFNKGDGPPELVDVQPGFPLWIEVVSGESQSLVDQAVLHALAAKPAAGRARPSTPAGVLFSQTAEDFVVGPLTTVNSDRHA